MARTRHKTVFDTGQQYLGSVYAKALLGAGEKAGNSEHLLTELDAVVDVLSELPALQATLASPRVPLDAKERMLDSAFADKVSPQLANFLKVIARRGRFNCLAAIAVAARHQFNVSQGRIEVLVESAHELDEAAIEEVTSTLQQRLGGQIDLHLSVDSELIAGLVIRVGDTVFDGSLANRLQRLRDEMITKSVQQVGNSLDRFARSE